MAHDDKRVEPHSGVDDEFVVGGADEGGEPACFAGVDEKEYDVSPVDNVEKGGVVLEDEGRGVIWHWDCQSIRLDLLTLVSCPSTKGKERGCWGGTTPGSILAIAAAAALTFSVSPDRQSSNVYKFCLAGFENETTPLSTILNFCAPHPFP